ncbi:recombination-associated protein RdgC, partial [Neisseria meningitidis]|uniref:recombination-associated protein RdgC n=1 Tax=Neisseria meningitidis TaxID=487 RepID=UPI000CA79EAA
VSPDDFTVRIALKKEKKALPAGVIRDILEEKGAKTQKKEPPKSGRKEKQELKGQIQDSLLPRPFPRSRRKEAVFNSRHGYLLV